MKLQKQWAIIPISQTSKLPVFKAWGAKATSDVATIKKWAAKYKGCNWGLLPSKSQLVVIDVDGKGLSEWKRLCKKYGEPRTLKAVTGSGKGLHYVFKHEGERLYRARVQDDNGKLTPGLDVRFNNYILIEPSKGKARPYKWVNKIKPAPLPSWLADRVVKKIDKVKRAATPKEFDADFYTDLITKLKDEELNYDEWLNIGMALHHATGGSDEGLDLYLDLTNGINYKDGDEAIATLKWESFGHNDGTPVTVGTLLHLAHEKGVRLPSAPGDPEEYFEDESEDVKEAKADMPEKVREGINKKLWGLTKSGRQVCEEPKELVKRLNNEGYALLNSTRKSGTVLKTFTRKGLPGYVELTNQQFKNAVAHIALKEVRFNKDGMPTSTAYKDADKVWLQNQKKTKYNDIEFKPKGTPGAFNLWVEPAIPCKPKKGNVNLVLRFIKDVLAAGNKAKYKYIVQWLAHIVQKPYEKPNVVLVIVGVEGTGKGFLTDGLMRGILGERATVVSSAGAIKNKFNKDLAFKFLITLDESCWQGDRELQSILRNRTGNRTLEVEEKFGARYEVEDYSRWVITANTPDAVRLQSSNRRYLVLESPNKYAEHEMFVDLWQGVKDGQLCNYFYNYLMQVDLDGFLPNRFPKELDTGGFATKVENDIYREFVIDAFIENPQRMFYRAKGVIKGNLYNEFTSFADSIRSYSKQISQHKFTRELKELVPLLQVRDKVTRFDDKIERVFDLTPKEFVESFYARLRLGAVPDDFNEDDMYLD